MDVNIFTELPSCCCPKACSPTSFATQPRYMPAGASARPVDRELPEQTTQLIHLDEPSGDLGAPIPRSCSTPESPTVSPSCYEVFLVPVVPHWSRSRPEWPPAFLQTRVLSSRTYGALRAGWRGRLFREGKPARELWLACEMQKLPLQTCIVTRIIFRLQSILAKQCLPCGRTPDGHGTGEIG
jgi:hypothetical protein